MTRVLVDRRCFLRSAGSAYLASLAPAGAQMLADADAVYASAYGSRGGEFGLALLSEAGAVVDRVTLPDRGHDIAQDPAGRRIAVFARQPGTFALVLDRIARSHPLVIQSVAGRHFFGHGLFSPDGRLLYATENDYDAASGVVGIYDLTGGGRRIGEFPTYGTGPHDIALLDDDRTLCVANGGIETHPDYGRAKLNLSTMEPSIVFIERETGTLLHRFTLDRELHQLSIRHMDMDAKGHIWFGCQYEGSSGDRPPLVGRVDMDRGIFLPDMPGPVRDIFRNYVGSVAANRQAGTVAFSSPEGNVVVTVDTETGGIASTLSMREVCGIAPDRTGFAASSGDGVFRDAAGGVNTVAGLAFDNHMVRIEATSATFAR